MRVIVAVCIYDRLQNLKLWLDAWSKCDQDAELVIIQNVDNNESFKRYCEGVTYIQRENKGYETGIIQDLFLGKLIEWDVLIFATDDTIPVKKDFVKQYVNALTEDVGVACMEISGTWTPHIRTTGFAIRRETAKKIHWVHKVTNKKHCYFFEHQGFEDTFMSQILKMDKRVIQLGSIHDSLMWDTHHHPNHKRTLL
jgi:hypothetical protein